MIGQVLKIVIISLILGVILEPLFQDLRLNFFSSKLDLESVKGKNVIVTGASTGIGEQTAYRYAELGANLVITARRKKVLDEVAEKCRKLGSPSVKVITTDMGEPAQVNALSKTVLKHYNGRIDHVILNHVGPYKYTFYDYDIDFPRWLTQVNYLSYIQLSSAFIPFMEKTGGSLVVISSIVGRIPVPFVTVYAGTKFALEGFFGSLRGELKLLESNVSISILPFGLIGTSSAKEATKDKVWGVEYESVADAGLAVVRVAVSKIEEHYWPWWTRLIIMVRTLAPKVIQFTETVQHNMTTFKDDMAKVKSISRKKVQSFLGK